MGAWIEIAIQYILTLFYVVAPHVGAWIEIDCLINAHYVIHVAPHVGAWIEIAIRRLWALERGSVAPHVGAWIEIITQTLHSNHLLLGRTPCGCVD